MPSWPLAPAPHGQSLDLVLRALRAGCDTLEGAKPLVQHHTAHYARPEPHISEFNRPVVEEYRANGGRVGGIFEGGDLLLLTTVGARSGREHTTPLGCVRDGARLLVVGSAGGAPRNPDWYCNLLAHPMVRVEVGSEIFDAVAVPTEGDERERVFAQIVQAAPGYGDYQAGVDRLLPVVALERVHADTPVDVETMADKLVEIHTWLRDQLHRVHAESNAYFATRADGGDLVPVGLGLGIRQHCLAFCESLEFHHTGEDAVMLPDMERQYPELAGAIARLRAEHHVVGRIRGELVELLADIATADADRFRDELDRMTRVLEAHLDYLEEALIPALAALPFPPA